MVIEGHVARSTAAVICAEQDESVARSSRLCAERGLRQEDGRTGKRLPEGVCLRAGEPSCIPFQAAKDAAWKGHKPSRENQE